MTTRRRVLSAIVASIVIPATLGISGAAAAPKAKTIALVLQRVAAPEAMASDAAAKAHLESLGYAVKVLDQEDPVSATAGADAILISATISSNHVAGKYRTSPIPILTWEPYILPHLGMTGRKENENFGTKERERWLWVVNAPHPATGGLPAGQVNVQKRNVPMGWGKPGLGASVLATFPGEDNHAAAFTYEKGATMDYENIAPARRAFIFVDTAAFAEMNSEGLKIFDASVAWVAVGSAGR